MVLGDAASTSEMFVWALNHFSRSITRFLFTRKASKLGQMTAFNAIFLVVVSGYRLVKI